MPHISSWVFARNGNAVASVLFAVAGLVGFGVVLGPIAVGLGLMARAQIAVRRQPGIRLAIAGIVLGVVAFAYPIIRLAA